MSEFPAKQAVGVEIPRAMFFGKCVGLQPVKDKDGQVVRYEERVFKMPATLGRK